jgi:hypothetical protein
MNGKKNLSLKAALVSLLMFLLLVGAWQLAGSWPPCRPPATAPPPA